MPGTAPSLPGQPFESASADRRRDLRMVDDFSKPDKMTLADNHSSDLAIGPIDDCQICGSSDLQPVIDMGFVAPCDSLLTSAQLRQPEASYPLKLFRCRHCGLVQLDHVVDPAKLFHPDYPYRSGITETLRKNLHAIARRVAAKANLAPGSLVIDVGSNDGTILQGFKAAGMRVLGIEPTRIPSRVRSPSIVGRSRVGATGSGACFATPS